MPLVLMHGIDKKNLDVCHFLKYVCKMYVLWFSGCSYHCDICMCVWLNYNIPVCFKPSIGTPSLRLSYGTCTQSMFEYLHLKCINSMPKQADTRHRSGPWIQTLGNVVVQF